MFKLFLSLIADKNIRDNFQKIQDFINAQKFLMKWEFFDIVITGAVTDKEFRHNLGVVPKDIIETFRIGTITYEYARFTKDSIFISTSGPATVRFFVGTYKEA
jgi:hypothetical protein